jgi:hypothetical protein
MTKTAKNARKCAFKEPGAEQMVKEPGVDEIVCGKGTWRRKGGIQIKNLKVEKMK